ncbi:Signaling protein YkoW [Phlyctema vagabunda]|uniref:Signaling protein YkoW n=1 Tax=Phlyctema vagabunda TaxID=108571 RepID=A0ABR4PWJ1_9HELO
MVIGAGAIAVLASVGALTVFFIWRSSWETSWWKRAICAIILAGAVSGMHWLASVGTQYRLRMAKESLVNNISRDATVIVVIVLSVGACILLFTMTFLAQRRRSLSANRAQQVVLAAAVFDNEGRLLVSPEGLLPNRKITNSFIERSFDDIFGISHPVFLWIFRTTRNWGGVANLLPGMRNHIHRAGLKGARPGTKTEVNLATDQGAPIEDYSLVFRELFCVAAADLAEDLNMPIENVGVLFDEIISTGQKASSKMKHKRETPESSVDIERNGLPLPVFGRGQLLFLVSRVNRREAEHLQAAGYRFANAQNVLPILARSMQVGSYELSRHLQHMREYSKESHILEPGVHLACFAIRASVRGGFDVLVRKEARNQLPTMPLPFEGLESWQVDYLRNFDSHSVSAITKALVKTSKSTSCSAREQLFAAQFLSTLINFKEAFDDHMFNEALLVAKPVQAPCRGQTEESQPGNATLITFRLMAPIHSQAPGNALEFIPLDFFRVQQYIYRNSPDHAVFARKTYREFAPVINVHGRSSTSMEVKSSPLSNMFLGRNKRIFQRSKYPRSTPIQTPSPAHLRAQHSPSRVESHPSRFRRFWASRSSASEFNEKLSSDTSSERGLVELTASHPLAFGGIMVSQEVSVDVKGNNEMDLELMELPSGGAGAAAIGVVITQVLKENSEGETFVDELFGICVQGR